MKQLLFSQKNVFGCLRLEAQHLHRIEVFGEGVYTLYALCTVVTDHW